MPVAGLPQHRSGSQRAQSFVPGGEVGEFVATIKEKDKGRLPFGFRIDDRKNW